MKNLFNIIIFSLFFLSCKAQTIMPLNTHNTGVNKGKYFKDTNNVYPNFVGTWENTTGNITFRLILWKVTKDPVGYPTDYYMDTIGGSFMIIKDAGTTNEIILQNSVKYYPQNNITSERAIWGRADNVFLGGHFDDNCANGGNGFKTGQFSLQITNPGTNPSIAHWKIKEGIKVQGTSYSMPLDVMMTKVN